MNLEESASYIEELERRNRNKKLIIGCFIICILLLIFLVVLIAVIIHIDSLKLKVYINDNKVNFSDALFRDVDGVSYVNINEFCQLTGYSYVKGDYGKYTEDNNSCYVKNDIEIASMKADSTILIKYMDFSNEIAIGGINSIVKSKEGDSQTYFLENPVKFIDGILYIPFDNLEKTFNVNIYTSINSKTSEINRIKIYTFDALVSMANAKIKAMGFSELSNSYENLRAVVDKMAVVGNGETFGVVSLDTGKELISIKYKDLMYIQNTKEFLVTADTKVGILSENGSTIVRPTEYDDISVFDELNKLYLVKKNENYRSFKQNRKSCYLFRL